MLSAQVTVTAPSEITLYARAFERLAGIAVYGPQARALIASAIDALGKLPRKFSQVHLPIRGTPRWLVHKHIGTPMGGVTMTGTAKADIAGQRRAVFAVDRDAVLAAPKEAWADGGYHAFSADHGTWSAISSAGQVLTGATPDELDRKIRAHWQVRPSQGAGR